MHIHPITHLLIVVLTVLFFPVGQAAAKSAAIHVETPQPKRFQVQGEQIVDRTTGARLFLRGIGYSPYLPGETPQQGAAPGDDGRYTTQLKTIVDLGANYLHLFPLRMPPGFFTALDATNLVYGQDIWIDPFAADILDEAYQAKSLQTIRSVIDHTYAGGRPDRLLLFSIGDELQAETVVLTNQRHPTVRDFQGKHLSVTGRTPSEVALARLIDAAMEYELQRYGQRHLYCHTSWSHIGPLADRPDLDLPREHVLNPDLGDLVCLNLYSYGRGVVSSPPGSATGTAYQGYLEELASAADRPILITQVGMSSSPVMPKPEIKHYGGNTPEQIAAVLRSVWRDIRTARGREVFCGIAFFELHDEWWKIGWVPGDENTHEPEDPEEWFGIYAIGEGNVLIPKGELPATVRSLFSQP